VNCLGFHNRECYVGWRGGCICLLRLVNALCFLDEVSQPMLVFNDERGIACNGAHHEGISGINTLQGNITDHLRVFISSLQSF